METGRALGRRAAVIAPALRFLPQDRARWVFHFLSLTISHFLRAQLFPRCYETTLLPFLSSSSKPQSVNPLRRSAVCEPPEWDQRRDGGLPPAGGLRPPPLHCAAFPRLPADGTHLLPPSGPGGLRSEAEAEAGGVSSERPLIHVSVAVVFHLSPLKTVVEESLKHHHRLLQVKERPQFRGSCG